MATGGLSFPELPREFKDLDESHDFLERLRVWLLSFQRDIEGDRRLRTPRNLLGNFALGTSGNPVKATLPSPLRLGHLLEFELVGSPSGFGYLMVDRLFQQTPQSDAPGANDWGAAVTLQLHRPGNQAQLATSLHVWPGLHASEIWLKRGANVATTINLRRYVLYL